MTTAKMRKALRYATKVHKEKAFYCLPMYNLAEMFLQLTTAITVMKDAYDAQLEKKGRKK